MTNDSQNTTNITEPWESNYALNSSLHKLLLHIQDLGPQTEDQVKRHCLNPKDIAGLMPESEKLNHSELMAEELIDLLDGNPEPGVSVSTQAWQRSARRVKSQLKWDMLAPITVKRATCRADLLLLHCMIENWLIFDTDTQKWQITRSGLAAIDNFHTNDSRLNIQDS